MSSLASRYYPCLLAARPGDGEYPGGRDAELIRRHLFALRIALLAADALIAGLLFTVIGQLRFGDAEWTTLWQALGVGVEVGALLYAATWVGALWFLGLYQLRVRWTISGELNDILVASLVLAAATMSFLFLVKLEEVSRLFLLILLVSQPIVTMAARLGLRAVFAHLRARGRNPSFMLVVGVGEEAQAFADRIERHRALGIRVVGHVRAAAEPTTAVTRPILGTTDDLERLLQDWVVDEVAICLSGPASEATETIIRLAADEGKHVRVPTNLPATVLDIHTEEFDGLLVRSYVHGPARMLSLASKRVIDIAGAALGLILLSPVFLIVALAIRLSNGAPVLFHQTRVGLHGRPFTMHKFRTMMLHAEEGLEGIRHLNERKGAAFKISADPRITRVGRVLRQTSLDELPQLWNVLRGEMSLVGPRPALTREVATYDIWHRRRLSMKPGITGLWQVEARREPSFDRWVEHDLAYIDSWSLWLDFKILARTVPAVVGRTGK